MFMMPSDLYGRVRFRDPSIAAVANLAQIVGENPDRIGLIIAGDPATGLTTISTKNSVAFANDGLSIVTAVDHRALILWHPAVGPLVGRAWFNVSGAARNFYVTEVILERDPIAIERPDNVRRQQVRRDAPQ